MGGDWAAYNQTYDPKTDLTDAEKARIIEFCQFVSGATDEDFAARIGDYLDLDAFARYAAVLVWIANPDSILQIGQNYYVYLHPTTNKLTFIAWDQDGSFGNFRNVSSAWPIFSMAGLNTFLGRVSKVEAFRAAYAARMAEFTETLFTPERFAGEMASIAPAIRPAIEEEGRQWLSGFDQVASGNAGLLPYVRARRAFVQAELAKQH
jgi:spore coat protein CotH